MTFAPAAVTFECGPELDEVLTSVSPVAAVFLISPRQGKPWIGRTGDIRRRLRRILRVPGDTSRMLSLREIAQSVTYWPVASRLESTLTLYEVARRHRPADYLRLLRLPSPPYIRLSLGTEFPRTHITTRLPATGLACGPFSTRATAEQYERELLDLFQIRRCHEDLQPHPEHPGCIYGEMNMCLRPCQSAVSREEYASEAQRVAEFLRTGGRAALQTAESSRDRLSEEMDFEGAANQHKRIVKIQALRSLRDDLMREVDRLFGVAVTPSTQPRTAMLWFLSAGVWLSPVPFSVSAENSVSMDRRVKELVAALSPESASTRERSEHLAILAGWYYSSWRDGIWIDCESFDRISCRRVVTAISKTVHQAPAAASE